MRNPNDTIATNADGLAAAAERDAAHQTIPGDMDSLIAALPALVRKRAPAWTGDSRPWCEWMRREYLSTGELAAAQFVLHVWNRYDNAKARAPYRFDLGVALNTWDEAHLATFATWARRPWYA